MVSNAAIIDQLITLLLHITMQRPGHIKPGNDNDQSTNEKSKHISEVMTQMLSQKASKIQKVEETQKQDDVQRQQKLLVVHG